MAATKTYRLTAILKSGVENFGHVLVCVILRGLILALLGYVCPASSLDFFTRIIVVFLLLRSLFQSDDLQLGLLTLAPHS
jgi:hypothetical protein